MLALERSSQEDLSRLFRARGERYLRVLDDARHIVEGSVLLMPVWQRYRGVVWEHLDPATLSPNSRAAILVPSALYGMNRADDAIADYRLTMHVSLPEIGNLARYWMPYNTQVLSRAGRGRTIVSLLPAEHARSIDCSLMREIIEVRFLRADGLGAVGHGAKAVKGRFARHLLDHGIDNALLFRYEQWKISRDETGFSIRASR